MNAQVEQGRNPGPSWGAAFLAWADRWWPQWIFVLA